MKIQYCSDLHLEFTLNRNYILQNPIKPVGDVLILGGDITLLNGMSGSFEMCIRDRQQVYKASFRIRYNLLPTAAELV